MTRKAVTLALEYLLEPALRLDLVDKSLGESRIRCRGDVRAGSHCHVRSEQLEDVTAACGHVQFPDHAVDFAGHDILSGGVTAYDVAVAGEVDVNVAVGTAEDHKDGLVILDSGIYIAVAVLAQRGVLDQLALGDGLGALPPLEDIVHVVPGLVLLGGTALAGEYAAGVAGESAGHVDADGAVTLLFRGLEEELGTVVNLRYAAGRQQESHSLLVAVEPDVLLAGESSEVVVVQENQDVVQVGVEDVVGHGHVDGEEARGRAVRGVVGLGEGVRREERQVEVHDGLQVGVVHRIERRIVLPPCREAASDGIPGLARDVEVGVLLEGLLAPAGAELCVHVRMGVLAYTVDAGVLYPPDAVLDEVVGNEGIALVEVGHSAVEPAVGEELAL